MVVTGGLVLGQREGTGTAELLWGVFVDVADDRGRIELGLVECVSQEVVAIVTTGHVLLPKMVSGF